MKVTVKTIDSGSKELELSDETTVQKLKDEILKEMGIPFHQQRLIFQGKVLKDDKTLKEYGVDGKVIHLVKRPPPSASQATPTTTDAAQTTPTTSAQGSVTATQDLLLVGTGMPTHSDLTQVTQSIVDRIVSSLSSHGAEAQVSAETVTTDAAGVTHKATFTARSDPHHPTAQPSTTTTTSTIPPQPQPTTTSKQKDKPPQQTPMAPSAAPSTSSSAAVPPQEEVKEKSKETAMESEESREAIVRRNRRENHTIYTHARTVKRCLDFSNKVLDRYDRGSARVKAKIAQEKRGEATEGGEEEVWPEVEPMEVLEGQSEAAGTSSGPSAAGKSGGASGGGEVKDERYAVLDDPDMPDFSAVFYAMLMDDLEAVQCRLRPLIVEYQKNAREDRELTEAESVLAAQVALTVRDVSYYTGHGNVSLARLHLNFLTPPPRMLRLAAPHKTEVRRVMMSMRRCFPSMPRPEEPSGYIVDISRDGEGPGGSQGSGERRTTRAVVNRGQLNVGGGLPGFAGMFGPMLSGVLGGNRQRAQEGTRPSTAGAEASTSNAASGPTAMAGASGADVKTKEDDVKAKEPCAAAMRAEEKWFSEDMTGLSEEERRKRAKRAKRMEEQLDMKNTAAEAALKRYTDERKRDEERKKRFAEEKKKEEEEKKREEEARKKEEEEIKRVEEERKRVEEERKKVEEVEAKRLAAAQQQASSGGVSITQEGRASDTQGGVVPNTQGEGVVSGMQEGVASNAQGEGGPGRDDETPRYLARLLSELITGVADPAGPHRPSEEGRTPGSEEMASAEGATSKSNEAAAEEKPSSGGVASGGNTEEGGEEPPRRSFAERYAGPEGTTVTISAAPSAPFGLPMEGPSLSIKNPGAGAEPEMTINFPVPPAIHLLQTLLERAEERHRERQANGESSSSSSSDEDADDEREGGAVGGGASREAEGKDKKKRSEFKNK